MGLIRGVLTFFASVLGSALASELKAWAPRITRRLIKCAVAQLPEDRRTRFQEEWTSHVNDIPGEIGKLIVALGCLSAAFKMSLILSAPHKRDLFDNLVKRLASGVIGVARDVRPPRHLMVSLATWATFTVFFAVAAPMIPRLVYLSPDPPRLHEVLSKGDLFITCVLIAADAIGRWIRCIALSLLNTKKSRNAWWGFVAVLACMFCLFVSANYCVTVDFGWSFRGATEVPPGNIAAASVAWFICTLFSAGLAVIAADSNSIAKRSRYPEDIAQQNI